MTFAGFRKQLNKANQFVSEKIGGAKGTELNDEFLDMDKRIETTSKFIEDVTTKTTEYLQPNPVTRSKLWTYAKIRTGNRSSVYPQPEGILGDTMQKHSRDLGTASDFSDALYDMGECFKTMADLKYALEDNIKQNFLDPLHQMKENEIKEVLHHKRKMEGRRLDYDCKKRQAKKSGGYTEEEINEAERKFNESKYSTEIAMYQLLSNEVENISQLCAFSKSLLTYHQQCADNLKNCCEQLERKRDLSSSKPKKKFEPTIVANDNDSIPPSPIHQTASTAENSGNFMNNFIGGFTEKAQKAIFSPTNNDSTWTSQPATAIQNNGNYLPTESTAYPSAPKESPFHIPNMQNTKNEVPHAEALYDFEAENSTELSFRSGDIINLVTKIDDNWFEGECKGRKGYLPITYVEVKVPLLK
ncbi:hypothetical protein SNEBB_002717 [Seison nebaliae]|nr:hypothetical protein SNEBB_002717 [Seison nebaliae]